MKKIITSSFISAFAAASAFAGVATTATSGLYEITNPIDTDVTLDAGKEYLLTEIVYVESGSTITIPAGTVIRGVIGQLNGAGDGILNEPGTLVITRGSQINAVGTPSEPIIFTYENDPDPKGAPTAPLISDTLVTGLWGGVIVLGNAPTNVDRSATNALLVPGTSFIEGLIEPVSNVVGGVETAYLGGVYGGDAPHDSSGTLKYISIRNGGFNLSADNEINGLTMGGVGDGTVVEYIEVIAGQDDGFEWFGGTVNSKYLLSAYNNDDAFDYDQGFSGMGQFWAAVMADNGSDGDKGGEFDGDDVDKGHSKTTPYAVPVIYNMTVIGTGAAAKTQSEGGVVSYKNGGGQIDYEENAGGSLFNSIIVATGDNALDINSTTVDMVDAGLLQVRNNIFFQDLSQTAEETATTTRAVTLTNDSNSTVVNVGYGEGSASLVLAGNSFTNPFFGGASFAHMATASRYEVGGVYLKPSATSAVTGGLEPYIGTFFDQVGFKGAFDPSVTAWTAGWTVPSQLGYFVE
ncbi:hypothetical protein ACWPKS_14235 [Coraliomargarita sp. W4R72]